MTTFRAALICAAVALFAGCAAQQAPKLTPAQQIQAREMHALDALHLRTKYHDVVTGWDIKGNTLVVYANRDEVLSMDEYSEDALAQQLLQNWTQIWQANHRGKSAKLMLKLDDFYGAEIMHLSGT